MRTVKVPLANRSYPIHIGAGLLADLGKHCARQKLGQRCAVISDATVARRYRKPALASLKAAGFETIFISQPAGEQAKTLKNVQACYDQLAKHRIERGSFIVALGGGVVGDLAGFDMLDLDPFDTKRRIGPIDFIQLVEPQRFDLWIFHQPVDQDLLGAQLVPAVDQGDLGGKVGQKQRFFYGGVATPDDHDFLIAIEEAVAGGAGGDALAFEFLFRLESEIHGGGAGSNDQGVAGVLAAIALEAEWAVTKVGFVDGVVDDAGFEAFGVLEHALHELRALNAVVVAGPVVDVGGGGELSTGLDAGHHNRVQVCTGGVDGSGIASGARAQNQKTAVFGFTH